MSRRVTGRLPCKRGRRECLSGATLLASLLADELSFSDEQRATVYYTNLVLWIGRHADSHEFSRWFGDDLAMRRDSYQLDWSGLPYMRFPLQRTGRTSPRRDAPGCCSRSCWTRGHRWRH